MSNTIKIVLEPLNSSLLIHIVKPELFLYAHRAGIFAGIKDMIWMIWIIQTAIGSLT